MDDEDALDTEHERRSRGRNEGEAAALVGHALGCPATATELLKAGASLDNHQSSIFDMAAWSATTGRGGREVDEVDEVARSKVDGRRSREGSIKSNPPGHPFRERHRHRTSDDQPIMSSEPYDPYIPGGQGSGNPSGAPKGNVKTQAIQQQVRRQDLVEARTEGTDARAD